MLLLVVIMMLGYSVIITDISKWATWKQAVLQLRSESLDLAREAHWARHSATYQGLIGLDGDGTSFSSGMDTAFEMVCRYAYYLLWDHLSVARVILYVYDSRWWPTTRGLKLNTSVLDEVFEYAEANNLLVFFWTNRCTGNAHDTARLMGSYYERMLWHEYHGGCKRAATVVEQGGYTVDDKPKHATLGIVTQEGGAYRLRMLV